MSTVLDISLLWQVASKSFCCYQKLLANIRIYNSISEVRHVNFYILNLEV